MNIQSLRNHLHEGQVIPALPLALESDGTWSEKYQRALLRYYVAAGAGGIAVGVHSTQFAIRDEQHGLFEPLLKLAQTTLNDACGDSNFARICGVCGQTEQASAEASLAREHGFHAALLSLIAWQDAPESTLLEHARAISGIIPIIGFYLQPAAGGRVFTYSFWRAFAEIENVVAIKMAPFNRYQTWDVVRAVMDAGRDDIALYTGNDDNIIVDLLTPWTHGEQTRFIAGGLLGQWGVWTHTAVEMLNAIKAARTKNELPASWLSKNVKLTDANAVIFDAASQFSGCIPGIHEVLYRQGLLPSIRCLDPDEVLSPSQSREIDRVCAAYPHLTDDAFVAAHLADWLS